MVESFVGLTVNCQIVALPICVYIHIPYIYIYLFIYIYILDISINLSIYSVYRYLRDLFSHQIALNVAIKKMPTQELCQHVI
jgi:hypothetical protein